MNTRYYFLIVLWAMSLFAPLHAQTYDKMWKEVEQLQKKDLPQSVVSASMKIYDKAKAERDVPQMMKAYLTAMQYRTLVTPDSLETDMKGLENWAKQTEKAEDSTEGRRTCDPPENDSGQSSRICKTARSTGIQYMYDCKRRK